MSGKRNPWPDWQDRPDGGYLRTFEKVYGARLVASVSFLEGKIVWHVRRERKVGDMEHLDVLAGDVARSAEKAKLACDNVIGATLRALRADVRNGKKRDAPLRDLYKRNSAAPLEDTLSQRSARAAGKKGRGK